MVQRGFRTLPWATENGRGHQREATNWNAARRRSEDEEFDDTITHQMS